MAKGSHVIEEYNHSSNIIICVCGWIGDGGEEWIAHKKWGKEHPFDRIIPPSLFMRTTRHKNDSYESPNWKELADANTK